MAREREKRFIYDHWRMFDDELWENTKQQLIDGGDENPSDDVIWYYLYRMDEDDWEYEKDRLEEFFSNGKYIAIGTVGLWYGNFPGGFIFETLDELLNHFSGDDLTLWDENGHFFLQGKNHDGTSTVEIRKLTPKGEKYYENWEYSTDKRTERQCHKKLFSDSHYSHMLHYMHKEYGCPKVAYKKKGGR